MTPKPLVIRENFVDVENIKTRYLEAGVDNSETLLLIHGGEYGSHAIADDWMPVMTLFADRFHVIALDSLGCGLTDNPTSSEDYLMGSVAEHAYRFMLEIGYKSAHIVGHSRGGYTATQLALEHPEFVSTLIIVSSGTLVSPPNSIYQEWERQAIKIVDPRERVRYLVAANSCAADHIDEEYIDQVSTVIDSAKTKQARATFQGEVRDRFYRDLADHKTQFLQRITSGELQTPTLVVWGFNDPSATMHESGVSAMDLILSNVSISEMHILNHAGHYCYREQPEAFVSIVKSFIKI
jgi:2-hydroxy-6-oxonona-2,4-dienedioate hydrolase